MRITGGRFRGRIVSCPPGIIRPAMDRMRESMFAILGPLDGLTFLDLFAGSGVVALEALSRGAAGAMLVEKDNGKRATILKNLTIATENPDFPIDRNKIQLVIRPVERVLKYGMPIFDIVHFDPPFPMKNKESLLVMAEKAGQPRNGGILMIHYPAEDKIPEHIGEIHRYDLRTYGRSHLAFYHRNT